MSRPRPAFLLPAALFLAASAASAAPRPSAGAPLSRAPYWFKFYSTAPYKEFWRATLTVKDFSRAVPEAADAVKKAGGTLTAPLADFAGSARDRVQQMSFVLPRKDSASLLRDLSRLGALSGPSVTASGAPIPLKEVREKIDRIMKEKREHAADLARVPAAAEAQEEILEHLLLVEEVASRTEVQVYFDLTVRGR